VLTIQVSAAPWIPVDEARVFVNGELVLTVPVDATPSDPLGASGVDRLDAAIPLAELAAGARGGGDYFVVVEAGMKLPLYGDLDDDGLADTTANDENGRVDSQDGSGRFVEPGRVAREDPRYFVQGVAPGVLPLAVTNPFFIDTDGGGFRGPRQR
jgi:hypothetical protein